MDKTLFLKYKTMRKCKECKEFITLEDDKDYLFYNESFHHRECLKKHLEKKKSKNVADVDLFMDDLVMDSESHSFNIIIKNHLYKRLMNQYNVILLPNYIFTKLEEIFKGNYKNMSVGIPPEHLLDMWERRQSYLDNIYHKEKMDGISRINYDLAVLIAKYPSYVDWLAKSKIDAKKSEEFMNKEKINMSLIKQCVQEEKNILDE